MTWACCAVARSVWPAMRKEVRGAIGGTACRDHINDVATFRTLPSAADCVVPRSRQLNACVAKDWSRWQLQGIRTFGAHAISRQHPAQVVMKHPPRNTSRFIADKVCCNAHVILQSQVLERTKLVPCFRPLASLPFVHPRKNFGKDCFVHLGLS